MIYHKIQSNKYFRKQFCKRFIIITYKKTLAEMLTTTLKVVI